MFTDKKITFDSFIKALLAVLLVVAVLFLLNRLANVLLPFFVAWLAAYLMYPIVHFFQYRLHMRYRLLAVLSTFLVVTAVIVGSLYLFIPPVVEEATRVSQLIGEYFSGNTVSDGIPRLLDRFISENFDQQVINDYLKRLDIVETVKTALPKVWGVLSSSLSLILSIVSFLIVLLYLFFILMDYEYISNGWIRIVPDRYKSPVSMIVRDLVDGMSRYFRGQSIVAMIVGILFCIGFTIIDFPLAILLGLFIGALNLVPYLQILGFIPTILLAVLKAADTGQSFWWILFCALAVFAVVQVIQDFFLVPKIMGKITGLNPAIILLSLSVWGSLLGVIGMIIALPVTTIIISYYKRFVLKKKPEPEVEEPES